MTIFDPYNLIKNSNELQTAGSIVSAKSMATLFGITPLTGKVNLAAVTSHTNKMKYRVRKLNKLLLARGLRIVEVSTTSLPSYRVDVLTKNHPYIKFSKGMAFNSTARNTMMVSGMTLYSGKWSDMDARELYLLTKGIYN